MDGTLLIVGATGTNGRELVARLAKTGTKLRVMSRDPARSEKLFPGIETVTADLAEPATLAPALDGVQRAYIVVSAGPEMVERYGAFIDAAKRAGLAHLVKYSAYGASPTSGSVILRQHAQADEALRASGLPFTILRPNSFFQNLLWSAGSIKAQGAFYLPSGHARIAAIDVRDIADATVAVLTGEGHAGKTYELTGPEAWTYAEAATEIGRVAGREVTYVPVSQDAAEQAMLGMGLIAWLARALAEIQGVFESEHFDRITPDLEALLGHKPRRLADFLQDFTGAFRGGAVA